MRVRYQSCMRFIAILAAALIFGGCGEMISPPLRTTSARNRCYNNLKAIDMAKETWKQHEDKTINDIPSRTDLKAYLPEWPACPSGGEYKMGTFLEPASCSLAEHKLP